MILTPGSPRLFHIELCHAILHRAHVRGKKKGKSHYFKRFILRNIVPQYPALSESL